MLICPNHSVREKLPVNSNTAVSTEGVLNQRWGPRQRKGRLGILGASAAATAYNAPTVIPNMIHTATSKGNHAMGTNRMAARAGR